MKVIGIDPAPTKATHVFDGVTLFNLSPTKLARYVAEQAQSDFPTLICWDAPLTGPQEPDAAEFQYSDQSQRPVEAFFSQKEWKFKVPTGISVRGYAGCPHWTISRRILGLPRVGRFDTAWENLPFELVAEGPSAAIRLPPKCIVEVHPALALWLWLRDELPQTFGWEYKRDRTLVPILWELLVKVLEKRGLDAFVSQIAVIRTPIDDDELDAVTSWLLGTIWLKNPSQVAIVGSRSEGSFLLPTSTGLSHSFQQFSSRRKY